MPLIARCRHAGRWACRRSSWTWQVVARARGVSSGRLHRLSAMPCCLCVPIPRNPWRSTVIRWVQWWPRVSPLPRRECVKANRCSKTRPFDTMGTRLRSLDAAQLFRPRLHKLRPFTDPAAALAKRLGCSSILKHEERRDLDPGRATRRDHTAVHGVVFNQLDPDVLQPIVDCHWLDGWDWKHELAKIVCPTCCCRLT